MSHKPSGRAWILVTSDGTQEFLGGGSCDFDGLAVSSSFCVCVGVCVRYRFRLARFAHVGPHVTIVVSGSYGNVGYPVALFGSGSVQLVGVGWSPGRLVSRSWVHSSVSRLVVIGSKVGERNPYSTASMVNLAHTRLNVQSHWLLRLAYGPSVPSAP